MADLKAKAVRKANSMLLKFYIIGHQCSLFFAFPFLIRQMYEVLIQFNRRPKSQRKSLCLKPFVDYRLGVESFGWWN